MLKLSQYLLYAYLLLKPYYLFSSGGLQIADFFLMASFLTLIIPYLTQQRHASEIQKAVTDNKLFAIFTLMTIAVNAFYFGQFVEFKFLLSSLYFIYNLIAIILFSIYLRESQFLLRIDAIFKFNLLVQLALFVAGVGGFYAENRYIGTFNDPNQLGYYVLISYMFIYLIKVALKHGRREWPFALVALFLILLTASTGMLLALVVFTALRLIVEYRQIFSITAKRIVAITLLSCATVIVVAVAYLYNNTNPIAISEDSLIKSQVNFVIDRLEGKTSDRANGSMSSMLEDRCIDKVLNHPQGIILGVGEGRYERFDSRMCNSNEVHSTWISMLFYYGILPFLVLIAWVFSKIKAMNRFAIIAILALFIESFTLINQRQSLFWAVIILASLVGEIIKSNHMIDGRRAANE